eukprot:m.421465 g.421465  ORF g.421465 m.421465 type:complete len:135 (-) comp16848_c0_seq2:2355-2759(-)
MISTRPSAFSSHTKNCCGPEGKDKRARNSGAKKRQPYTFAFKWSVLRTLDDLKQIKTASKFTVDVSPVTDTANLHNINKSLVSQWEKKRESIITMAKTNRHNRKMKKGSPRYKFADVDAEVVAQFKNSVRRSSE